MTLSVAGSRQRNPAETERQLSRQKRRDEEFIRHKARSLGLRVTEGRCVLIVAHGNSLRRLVKHLGGISD
jgi:bisphosphoglycerate-dependent phosphoglycerate mutase